MKHEYIVSAMLTAFQISQHSHCVRRKAGAVIIACDGTENRPEVLGWGANGMPSGHSTNVCELEASPDFVPEAGDPYGHLMTNPEVIHAEIRALAQAGDRARGAIMVCTDTPCPDCMQALKAAGISEFFFMFPYRLMGHLKGATFKISQIDHDDVLCLSQATSKQLSARIVNSIKLMEHNK